jgi:hypothetical protein
MQIQTVRNVGVREYVNMSNHIQAEKIPLMTCAIHALNLKDYLMETLHLMRTDTKMIRYMFMDILNLSPRGRFQDEDDEEDEDEDDEDD